MYFTTSLVAFPSGAAVKNLPANAGDEGLIPGHEDPLQKEMETPSSILAWSIPRTEKPGGQQVHRIPKGGTGVRDVTTTAAALWGVLPLQDQGGMGMSIEPTEDS